MDCGTETNVHQRRKTKIIRHEMKDSRSVVQVDVVIERVRYWRDHHEVQIGKVLVVHG